LTFSLRNPRADQPDRSRGALRNGTGKVSLTQADQDLIKQIFDEQKIPYHPETMFQDTEQLSKALLEGFGNKVFDYASEDNLVYSMMEINLNRFGFNKNVAEIVELNNALRDSKGFSDFKDKAGEILGTFKTTYLRTEYDLAVATGQNSARYLNQMAEAAIFPYLQYQTAGDDKVREEHAALDGKVFSIHDPELDAIYPPNGFNCRCEMVQVDSGEAIDTGITTGEEAKGLLAEDWDNMKKYGFDRNPAKTGEIFDLNRIYADQLDQARPKDLYDLTFNDVNLPMATALKSTLQHGNMPLDDLSQDTLLKAFDKKMVKVGDKKFNLFTDHANRPIGLQRETLVGQTSGSFVGPKEMRNSIFVNMEDVLAKPDEVWLMPLEDNAYKQIYIRYYDDQAMVVTTLVDMESGRRISSWSMMNNEVATRRGLLIYKGYGK
jgi:SPP1 gp7 family putative phage head morphogenesis protein